MEREKVLQARYDKLNFDLQNLQVEMNQAAVTQSHNIDEPTVT